VRVAEREHAAQPLILLEGNWPRGADHDVRAKSSGVCAPPGESAYLPNGIGRDHGNGLMLEDPVFQLHHLHAVSVTASDLRGQRFTEDGHRFAAPGRQNMCQRFTIRVLTPLRSE
jgi:hypothetical protein